MYEMLALELASTVRMARGGPVDTIDTPERLTGWVRQHHAELSERLDTREFTADEAVWRQAVSVRLAVRALFARAVAPVRPSAADADRLPPPEDAVEILNRTSAAAPTAIRLDWPPDGEPRATSASCGGEMPADLVLAALAGAAIGFLAGPLRTQLRTCLAPGCVLYFVKEHGRQEWCSTACGNRARAARHYRRHRAVP